MTKKVFESLKRGLKEAIAWKQGKKTGARVREYTAADIARINKKQPKNNSILP